MLPMPRSWQTRRTQNPALVTALTYAQDVGTPVIGIVGKDGGYTAKVAVACAIVPTVNPEHITPHSEAFQAVVCRTCWSRTPS